MRVCFTKKDASRFMSHLDLMRMMMHALRRAHIPVKLTQGFNPHLRLVFSIPLPLGIASDCELLDMDLDRDMKPEEIRRNLAENIPMGIEIPEVYQPDSSLNDIAYARYRLEIPAHLSENVLKFLSRDSIPLQKKGKKGKIRDLDLKEDFSMKSVRNEDGSSVITVRLPCGSERNVGINLLLDAFYSAAGQDEHDIRATRVGFETADGTPFR